MMRTGGSYRARNLECDASHHRSAGIQHQQAEHSQRFSDRDIRATAMIDLSILGSVLLTSGEWSCRAEPAAFACPGKMEPC
jgi:hypothetical protein